MKVSRGETNNGNQYILAKNYMIETLHKNITNNFVECCDLKESREKGPTNSRKVKCEGQKKKNHLTIMEQ